MRRIPHAQYFAGLDSTTSEGIHHLYRSYRCLLASFRVLTLSSYLGFMLGCRAFAFRAMPFRLYIAPRVFYKADGHCGSSSTLERHSGGGVSRRLDRLGSLSERLHGDCGGVIPSSSLGVFRSMSECPGSFLLRSLQGWASIGVWFPIVSSFPLPKG